MVAIKLSNVSKKYPGVLAVDDVSFSVKKSSVHGFLGPNGAGKSTVMKMITGLIPPTCGTIEVNGTKVGFLPEDPPLYLDMQVREYIKFVAKLNGVERADLKNKIDEILDQCGLAQVSKRLIGNLSKGYKQRVGIAQTLVYGPEIIILDEPTIGLDPNSIVEIRDLITSLKTGHTILLSSHQLHEVNLLCSDITIIKKGKIVGSGTIADIGKKLQAKQVINFELVNWNQEVAQKLSKSFPCDKIEHNKLVNSHAVRLFFYEEGDFKARLSRFLVENDCGLLAFKENELGLESIFKLVTEGKKQ
ncbi:MAG: ABC transporter ATP-binding protein [Bacteriovoracaceae bacterium]|nr:ABC transporter ATP-binding protein [Bacteriovoracaceae bacterium]